MGYQWSKVRGIVALSLICLAGGDWSVRAEVPDTQGSLARLPLLFEPNRGQAERDARFLARGPGYAVAVYPDEALLALRRDQEHPVRLRISLLEANPRPAIFPLEQTAGRINYFIGNDPRRWRTGIPTYQKVKLRGVYPGIDLVYYGTQGMLEYDFIIAPGADPKRIGLSFTGGDELVIDGEGNLLVQLGGCEVRWSAPRAYQLTGGSPEPVAAHYVLGRAGEFRFAVGDYDHSRPLIIDPLLLYSTYLGGTLDDGISAITVDGSGHAYVTGETASNNFPLRNAMDSSFNGPTDAFVSKIGPQGTNLVFSTYLGGNNSDAGRGIAIDASSNIFVVGFTDSSNFPTLNAYQASPSGFADAVVVKLNSAGSAMLYGTHLGGADDDVALGVAVDDSGRIHVVGTTASLNFPTKNAYQSAFRGGIMDAFVARLNPASSGSSSLLYSTYLGGNDDEEGHAIAVDSNSRSYVTGNTSSTNFPVTAGVVQTNLQGFFVDAFVTKLNPANSGSGSLVYSTYLGGDNAENLFAPGCITVDASGNVWVAGSTAATNFPVTAGGVQTNYGGGLSDAFLVKLNTTATAVLYGSYLGGVEEDTARGVALDAQGRIHLGGATSSTNFPATPGAFQPRYGGGESDAFAAKIDPAVAGKAGLVSASFLGGLADDYANGIALQSPTNVFLAGETSTNGFPVTSGAVRTNWAGGFEGFVARLIASAETGLTTASPEIVQIGDGYAYTIVVTNKGELAATGVVVTNRLSSLLVFQSAVSSQGSCTQSGGVVVCSLGTLPLLQSANITISVLAPTPGVATNTTHLRFNEPDPVLTNNAATNVTVVGSLVTVTPQIPDAAEPGTTGRFVVARMGSTQSSLTVNYTVDGTATPGVDYFALSGSVTINAGSFGRSVVVTPIDDGLAECLETVVLTISPAVTYTVGDPGSATVPLHDDEPPPVSVIATTPNAAETGPVAGAFTVTRCIDNTNVTVSVNVSLGGTALNGIDYSNIVTVVEFPVGADSVVLPVIPILDSLAEGDETVMLSVSPGVGYTPMSPTSASVTIADTAYGQWLFTYFGSTANNPGIGGDADDPDGDGIPNLLEYALNLDPSVPGVVGLPTATIEDGFLTLTYRVNKAATGLIFTVEVASDLLGAWNSGPAHTSTPELVSDDGSTQTFKVRDLTPVSGLAARYIRLRVTR